MLGPLAALHSSEWTLDSEEEMTMVKRSSVCIGVLGIASIGWAAIPERQLQLSSAISCRHDQAAKQDDRARHAQALTLAKAINVAEAELVRRTRQYQPLESLHNLPAVPSGFQLNLHADRSGYIFAIKDTSDPCRFAVFSDAGGLLYEKSALNAPVIAQ
jgi:hypothetical protein